MFFLDRQNDRRENAKGAGGGVDELSRDSTNKEKAEDTIGTLSARSRTRGQLVTEGEGGERTSSSLAGERKPKTPTSTRQDDKRKKKKGKGKEESPLRKRWRGSGSRKKDPRGKKGSFPAVLTKRRNRETRWAIS